ncbi:Nudix hydrolase 14-like protein [Lachnellula arida]|uniref:Nudix hydrolase 14-like protein n=1 Tax=Lachnellula arida TaxID=1316785 RepID=A0A8T9BLB9_9HELO|nr:Nudix hydrolase 14-like protein [Lachnellula arida]
MTTPNDIDLRYAKPHPENGGQVVEFESFILRNFSPPVTVTLARDLDPKFNEQLLRTYEPFVDWVKHLRTSLDLQKEEEEDSAKRHPFHDDPYELKSIHIQAVDFFGKRIGFLKYTATILNKRASQQLPGSIFMRGGSVGMLMILRPKDTNDERWVIMTEQARIPAGSLSFLEIPAGMIDELTSDFKGAAAKEIEEETGLTINRDHLLDMTELALRGSPNPENMKAAMYPSPGGSDEFIALFLWEQEMERLEIESLREKLTGDKKQGEMITLKLIPYEDLWKVATRDAKTMVAWALYESLKRAGILDDLGNVVHDGAGGEMT